MAGRPRKNPADFVALKDRDPHSIDPKKLFGTERHPGFTNLAASDAEKELMKATERLPSIEEMQDSSGIPPKVMGGIPESLHDAQPAPEVPEVRICKTCKYETYYNPKFNGFKCTRCGCVSEA